MSLLPNLNPSGGKSSILLDIKPWDDETDMAKLEAAVRKVEMNGLTWGACKSKGLRVHFALFRWTQALVKIVNR